MIFRIYRFALNFLRKMKIKLFKSKPTFKFLHLGDLITKQGDNLSDIQYIIISRIIDVEQYRNGDKSFFWQRHFTETSRNRPFSEKEIMEGENSFENLIVSLDINSLNPNMSTIDLFTDKKSFLLPNHGTHRFAWCYTQNYMFVPVSILKEPYPRAYVMLDGKSYWISKGIKEEELMVLDKKQKEIEEKINYHFLCLLNTRNKFYEYVKNYLNTYNKNYMGGGNISYYGKPKEHLNHFPKLLKEIKKNKEHIEVYEFRPLVHHLYFSNSRIFCREVKEIYKHFRKKGIKNWGYISQSLTETLELEPLIFDALK